MRKASGKKVTTKKKYLVVVGIVVATVLLAILFGTMLANHRPASDAASNTSSAPADRVEVVYFHRTQQCYSCRYAQERTRYTVETYFEDELVSGNVTFHVFNVQDKANGDIVEKYNNVSYSTLCINTVRDGTDHIEAVTDIWFVIGDDEAFIEIVKNKIEKSLKGEL